MRRRPRIDLGQDVNSKEEEKFNRKRQRWMERNKDRPEGNPFLKAISPDQELFGEPDEKAEELKKRLNNLEFGNFPGYFNYRKKAASENKSAGEPEQRDKDRKGDLIDESQNNSHDASPIDAGLSDERIGYLKKEWFEGRSVLDIGCNRGHITYAIARLFSPKFIVGIDIDLKMINMANRDLHLHLEDGVMKEARKFRQQRAAKLKLGGDNNYVEDSKQFPLSSYIAQGPLIAENKEGDKEGFKKEESVELQSFPNNIVFVEHNYVLSRDELLNKQKEHFDTIVCLSVTKWIHLNYRDEGLKRFFKRIYKHLTANGLLILEAQPFDNYARRKKLSDRLKANFYSIQFKPNMFDEYLLSKEVGFKQIIQETTTEHECAGFKRPLKVFLK